MRNRDLADPSETIPDQLGGEDELRELRLGGALTGALPAELGTHAVALVEG